MSAISTVLLEFLKAWRSAALQCTRPFMGAPTILFIICFLIFGVDAIGFTAKDSPALFTNVSWILAKSDKLAMICLETPANPR
ncbi:MAG: hypothetical protein R2795_13895 [Saprospiraceae bacterium]